jgi:thiol-disulfide isomerase/thioredoxin
MFFKFKFLTLSIIIFLSTTSFVPQKQQQKPIQSSGIREMETDYFLDNYDKPKNEIWVCYFWATWCVNCIKNHDILEQLDKQFKDQHVRVISLAPDDKRDTWENFLMKHPSGWEQIYATDLAFTKKFRKTFGVITKLPQMFIIKRTGKTQRVKLMNQLRTTLQQIIEE